MCVNVMLMLAGQDDSSTDPSDSCDASNDKYSSLTVEEAAILCDQQEKKHKANNQCWYYQHHQVKRQAKVRVCAAKWVLLYSIR